MDMTTKSRKNTAPGIYEMDLDDQERVMIERAIDAVCTELGLIADDDRRRRVTCGVVTSWRDGRRQPLNLVSGGLEAAY